MMKNKRLAVIAMTTAALGLGGTLVAYLAEQGQSLQTVVASDSTWDGFTRTPYSDTTVSYNGGTYYVIENADELAYVATDEASWAKDFLVTGDIDLGNRNWTPIAPVLDSSNIVSFTGIIDFNGHIVSNLKLDYSYALNDANNNNHWNNGNRDKWTASNIGLFGNASGAIRNLNLKDVSVSLTSSLYRNYVGAVAGYNGGTIESVTLNGLEMNVTFNAGGYRYGYENASGALVGFNGGTVQNALYLRGEMKTSNYNGDWWNGKALTGTIYGKGNRDSLLSDVYADTEKTSSAIGGWGLTDNWSFPTPGDLSDGTVEEAIETINDSIAESSSTKGNAALRLSYDGDIVLFGGHEANSGGEASDNEATDMLADFLLLRSCVDCDKVGDYWNFYSTDPTVKSAFDDYPMHDSATNEDYTAGSRLAYMHNYSLSKTETGGLISKESLSTISSEGEAILIVGTVSVTLAIGGYFLLKRKTA